MIRKDELPYCPIATLLQLIGSKWKILIIQQLELRECRFNELLKALDGISKYVLSDSLRSMRRDGIIDRRILSAAPYQVEYSLNELGRSLIPVLHEMAKWGMYYKECMSNATDEKCL